MNGSLQPLQSLNCRERLTVTSLGLKFDELQLCAPAVARPIVSNYRYWPVTARWLSTSKLTLAALVPEKEHLWRVLGADQR